MTSQRFFGFCGCLVAVTAGLVLARASDAAPQQSRELVFRNSSGILRTVTTESTLDLSNPFFQPLGTNGRSCATCHVAEQGWSFTPEGIQARFRSQGLDDPIFRNNDGSNCEGVLPVGPQDEWGAYSLLLTRGLIRVGLDVPPDAEFIIDSVDDPLKCLPATQDVSVYRRPLPSTNLRFLSAVMWDGRESSLTSAIVDDLGHQANDATRGHAQAFVDITAAQARQIVAFESALFTTQAFDNDAGMLSANGGGGGAEPLSTEAYFIGVNDPLGFNPTKAPFTSHVFTVFDEWLKLPASMKGPVAEGRRAIARGQDIFNHREFTVSGVGGLNDETFSNGVTLPSSFTATCTVCHDSPNAGSHSVKAPLDLGLTEPGVAPYLPVYTLRNLSTGDRIRTTDPGRALITGKWRDLNRFKGPVLRGLAARAPYFHNGSATTLADVVDFYDQRFGLQLSARDRADLIAFLRAL
jgi:hypothetical protein